MICDDPTQKSMKQFSRFVPPFFRNLDLSLFWVRLAGSFPGMKSQTLISLKSLLVLGFLFAVIPLFLGVMYAALSIRETSALGRTINTEVFEQTKTVRLVLQKASDVERKARLFVLLSDPSLRQPYERESYEAARASLQQALSDLLKLHVGNKIALLTNELSEKEKLIYLQIMGSDQENDLKLPIDDAFQGLRESSQTLSREFENHVDRQFDELHMLSESLERGLLIKGAFLLLVSFGVILTLLVIISRAMKQLDLSIGELVSGNLTQAIQVQGPSDLRYLGDRLEWLRTHLIELETSKHQFMQNVAREIEAPLQGIRESAQQLTTDNEASPFGPKDIAFLLSAHTEKLKTISDELLRYSRISTKPENNLKQTVNIKDLLEAVIADFQPRLQAKSLKLKKLVKPVSLFGSREQLQNIIGQLLDNAVKYSPVNGEIRIMLRNAGVQMELEIEDEGPGIPDDERAKVFEPFYHGAAEDQEEGTGLGLSIVKEYVINHQGKVEFVDARQDQRGARVRVRLPLSTES